MVIAIVPLPVIPPNTITYVVVTVVSRNTAPTVMSPVRATVPVAAAVGTGLLYGAFALAQGALGTLAFGLPKRAVSK